MRGLTLAVLAFATAACAAPPKAQKKAPPPAPKASLPVATYHQLVIAAPSRTVLAFAVKSGLSCCTGAHPVSVCVVDIPSVLDVTPEVRKLRAGDIERGTPEYHILIYHANERANLAVRRVAQRKGHDLVMERGAVRLRNESKNVAMADITADVLAELGRP
jgi:hypothetical protein